MIAPGDQDFNKQPCRSLVSVDEPMIVDHAVEQSRAFVVEARMIPGIRPGERRLDQVQAANSVTTPKSQSLIMCRERIGELKAIVTLSDQPSASAHLCGVPKPPRLRFAFFLSLC